MHLLQRGYDFFPCKCRNQPLVHLIRYFGGNCVSDLQNPARIGSSKQSLEISYSRRRNALTCITPNPIFVPNATNSVFLSPL